MFKKILIFNCSYLTFIGNGKAIATVQTYVSDAEANLFNSDAFNGKTLDLSKIA